MSPVIVLWAGDLAKSLADLEDAMDAVVLPLDAATLLSALPLSITREGVVAIITDPEDADRALALGVDEVLRADRADADLAAAISRARLRAAARASREVRIVEEMSRADGEVLELVVAAMAHELRTPLAVASLNSELLREAIGALGSVADEVAQWAAANAPPPAEELGRILAKRFAAPSTLELDATSNDIAAALRKANHIIKKMSALALEGGGEQCDLSASLWKVESLMRGLLERIATFVVDVPPSPLRVALSRAQLVQTITALLSNAYQACVEAGVDGRRIELRLFAHEWMAVVEVFDNGIGMSPEVRRRAQTPFFTTRRPGALGLGLTIAGARIRRAGGDMLIESELAEGTRVRVFFPSAGASEASPDAPEPEEN